MWLINLAGDQQIQLARSEIKRREQDISCCRRQRPPQ